MVNRHSEIDNFWTVKPNFRNVKAKSLLVSTFYRYVNLDELIKDISIWLHVSSDFRDIWRERTIDFSLDVTERIIFITRLNETAIINVNNKRLTPYF